MKPFNSTMRIAAAAAVLAVAAPVTIAAAGQQEQTQTATGTATAEKAQEKAERPICRRVSHATGSRLEGGNRVCLTREQWRQRSTTRVNTQGDLQD